MVIVGIAAFGTNPGLPRSFYSGNNQGRACKYNVDVKTSSSWLKLLLSMCCYWFILCRTIYASDEMGNSTYVDENAEEYIEGLVYSIPRIRNLSPNSRFLH